MKSCVGHQKKVKKPLFPNFTKMSATFSTETLAMCNRHHPPPYIRNIALDLSYKQISKETVHQTSHCFPIFSEFRSGNETKLAPFERPYECLSNNTTYMSNVLMRSEISTSQHTLSNPICMREKVVFYCISNAFLTGSF